MMQMRINNLHETLKSLQKSFDDALNQTQTAEILLNTKLSSSEALVRDQIENNLKQRYANNQVRHHFIQFPISL